MTNHWFLPVADQTALLDVLAEVPEIVENLAAAQSTSLQAASWEPKVSVGEQSHPLPYDNTAVMAGWYLCDELQRWVEWLEHQTRIPAPDLYPNKMAAHLTRHILILAATPGSETAHTDLHREIKAAKRASGRATTTQRTISAAMLEEAGTQQLNARGICTVAKQLGPDYANITMRRINHLSDTRKIVAVRYADKKTPIYLLADVLIAHITTPTRNRIAG